MKKLIFFFVMAGVLFGATVWAQNLDLGGGALDKAVGKVVNTTPLASRVGTIVASVLSVLGTLFLVLTIYAGILWMTASGEEDKIAKAKQILSAAIIGLAIVMSAYTITYFVGSRLGASAPADYYYSCEVIGSCTENGGTTTDGKNCSADGCAAGEVCCAVKK